MGAQLVVVMVFGVMGDFRLKRLKSGNDFWHHPSGTPGYIAASFQPQAQLSSKKSISTAHFASNLELTKSASSLVSIHTSHQDGQPHRLRSLLRGTLPQSSGQSVHAFRLLDHRECTIALFSSLISELIISSMPKYLKKTPYQILSWSLGPLCRTVVIQKHMFTAKYVTARKSVRTSEKRI